MWGAGRYDSEGCCRGVFEDVGGVVVGVENPPGLEIGDSALDSVADLTDDSVPFVVSPVRVPAWWLTPGGIHSGAGAASVACAGAPRRP